MGEFVGFYDGRLITEEESHGQDDTYTFGLDHFFIQDDKILSMHESELNFYDALEFGNVSRFFNHSCESNMLIQPFLTDCENTEHNFRPAFFANRDIEPNEELTYNYGYEIGSVPGKEIICMCGAKDCTGRLL